MNSPRPIASLLHLFFHEHLVTERNASVHTVRSYRDAWSLFLRFAAERHRCAVARLGIEELGAADVLAFLDHVERERHAGIGTRNCRLAALKSFYAFVATREPALLAQCTAVLNVRTKRKTMAPPMHLEPAEVDAILAQPDRSCAEGLRDYVLLAFLYNTGARIQEALDVRPGDLRLAAPASVRLTGKGRKVRLCPLWPETVSALRDLLARQPRHDDEPIFQSRSGRALGATGVRFKLARYVAAAASRAPTLARKHVTPHTFRHSVAVALVSVGTDLTVIASWLGHASLETTNWYARANLATTRAALERLDPPIPRRAPRWKREAGLLEWLESL